jgi:Cft2 family RNA processing exonuclease
MHFTNLTRKVEIGANCYRLEADGKKFVLDCGMHPKEEGDAAMPNLGLLDAEGIDAVILSHAHQDHVGSTPVLMRKFPDAPLLTTEATRQLGDIMLHNSVNVMMKRREEAGLSNYPLFTHREVDVSSKRWLGCPLHQPISARGDRMRVGEKAEVSFEFFDAGHILGAAGILIRAEDRTVFYTGDVNLETQTISSAAHFPKDGVDVLITETTRGDHPQPEGYTRAAEEQRLAEALATAFSHGGGVLMPLFALGKTQEMLSMFYEFRRKGLLATAPIYIGGLSAKLTELYDRLAHSVPRERPDLQILDAVAPFVAAGRDAAMPGLGKGRIFALSSGMMTEKTLSNSFARQVLSDPKQSLFFVGYADPDSPAGKIKAAKNGDLVQVDPDFAPQELRCHVEQFNFSGHSSRESLRNYIKQLRPKKVILVHGDPPAVGWFQEVLSADLPGSEIICPQPGVRFEI